MHRILIIAATALLLTISCDSADSAKNKGAASAPTATKAATPAAAAQDGPAAAASGTFASLSECLDSCDRPDVIPTNQATCRLNCDAAYGASATGQQAGPVDPVTRTGECLGTCYAGSSSPEACAGTCKTTAASAAPAPAAEVLDNLDTCIRTCHADKTVIPTNRRTCELNCTQRARVAATPPPSAAAAKAP